MRRKVLNGGGGGGGGQGQEYLKPRGPAFSLAVKWSEIALLRTELQGLLLPIASNNIERYIYYN